MPADVLSESSEDCFEEIVLLVVSFAYKSSQHPSWVETFEGRQTMSAWQE